MLPTWTTKIISEPATEPVTLAQVKLHSRISHSEDDTWLTMAIIVARQYVEKTCELSLITQTRRTTFAGFHKPWLTLAYGPTVSISAVQYYDQTNSLQTLATYQAALESNPCLIVPAAGEPWPSTMPNRIDAVKVTSFKNQLPRVINPGGLKSLKALQAAAWVKSMQDTCNTFTAFLMNSLRNRIAPIPSSRDFFTGTALRAEGQSTHGISVERA